MSELSALILAAGFSSRMTGFKPLLDLDGAPALVRCIQLFQGAGISDCIVVTGHEQDKVDAMASEAGARTVFNPAHAEGMFGSVRTGVGKLDSGCEGFFLLPVDIPLVRQQTIRTLAGSFTPEQHAALIPHFLGHPGHPPLIAASLKESILASSGDAGGLRCLLDDAVTRTLEVPDAGVLLDMDTDQDLENIRTRLQRFALPTSEECNALLDFYDVPQNIREHCSAVAKGALAIARALNAKRELSRRLDLDIVQRAALVHDLAKGNPQHEEQGGQLLREWDFTDIAGIVAAHRDTVPVQETRDIPITENEVVFMADKLIKGVRCVPLAERYGAVLERHGHDPEAKAAIEGRKERALALLQRFDQELGQELMPLVRKTLHSAHKAHAF